MGPEEQEYDFTGDDDVRWIHIPDGQGRAVGAKLEEALIAIIREAAGVDPSDTRKICPGCMFNAAEAMKVKVSDDFDAAGFKVKPPERRKGDALLDAILEGIILMGAPRPEKTH